MKIRENRDRNGLISIDSKKADSPTGRVLCTDRKGATPIIALVNDGLSEELGHAFYSDGKIFSDEDNELDLFFAPEKHEGWINIKKTAFGYYCSSHIFRTKEDAENHEIGGNCLVVTKKVEWEE